MSKMNFDLFKCHDKFCSIQVVESECLGLSFFITIVKHIGIIKAFVMTFVIELKSR
jgi:hypothetical protein